MKRLFYCLTLFSFLLASCSEKPDKFEDCFYFNNREKCYDAYFDMNGKLMSELGAKTDISEILIIKEPENKKQLCLDLYNNKIDEIAKQGLINIAIVNRLNCVCHYLSNVNGSSQKMNDVIDDIFRNQCVIINGKFLLKSY
jgi:hypothetical protein